MSITAPTTSVFLSYAMGQRQLADSVRTAFVEAGIEVWDPLQTLEPSNDLQISVMKALADSDAVVIALPEKATIPANVMVEIGAAMAWLKPIFAVLERAGATELPSFLKHVNVRVFPASRIDDLANHVRGISVNFTEGERQALKDAYQVVRIPVDRLLSEPGSLQLFAEEFAKRSKIERSGERLMRELLALRKRGEMPKISVAPPSRSHRRSASG